MPRTQADENGETLDRICGELEIYQARRGYRFGIETLLLCGFVAPGAEKLVDLGTGSGVMPMVMCHFGRAEKAWGVELQASMDAGFREFDGLLPAGGFDRVIANPPYETGQAGHLNVDPEKAAARHELNGTLDELVAAATRLLKPPGRLCLVAPPKRLPDTFAACEKHGLRPARLRFAYGRVELPPKHFLLEAIRGGRADLEIEPPLIIYENQERYTKEVEAMLYPKGRG